MLEICHDTDLVRTNSWRHYFASNEAYLAAKAANPRIKNFTFGLLDGIKRLFPDKEIAEKVMHDLLLLAKKCCEATGTPVHYEGFPASERVDSYDKPIADPQLLHFLSAKLNPEMPLKEIKSHWTRNVQDCMALVNELLSPPEEHPRPCAMPRRK